MKVESLSLKAFKEDRQLCARASILVALLVIAVLGVALAYTSTPCYHFLVSQQGIVSSVAIGVGLVALMVFWSGRKVKEKSTVATSKAAPVQASSKAIGRPADSVRAPLKLKWDVVEVPQGEEPRIAYLEKGEVDLLLQQLTQPNTCLGFTDKTRVTKREWAACIVVDANGKAEVADRPVDGNKFLNLVANKNALPIAVGDLEIVATKPSSDNGLQTLNKDEVVCFKQLLASPNVPPKSVLIYRTSEGQIKMMLPDGTENFCPNVQFASSSAQAKGYSPLFIRKRELQRDWEIDPNGDEAPPLLDEAEVRKIFEDLQIPVGQVLLIRNRDTRELEYWMKSKSDSAIGKVSSSDAGALFQIRTKEKVSVGNWMIFRRFPFLLGPNGCFDQPVTRCTLTQALEIATHLKENEKFSFRKIESGQEFYMTKQGARCDYEVDDSFRRVWVADQALGLKSTLSEWGFEVVKTRQGALPEPVIFHSNSVVQLQRLSRAPLSVLAFYEIGRGYGAILVNEKGIATRVPPQKSLKELIAQVPKDKGYYFVEMCPKNFELYLGDIRVFSEKSHGSPTTLFDDEITKLKSCFERGVFGNGAYLFYSTKDDKARCMSFIDGQFFDQEVIRTLDKERASMEVFDAKRELTIRREDVSECNWEFDNTPKPAISLSDAASLRQKLGPNEFFVEKSSYSNSFVMHAKSGMIGIRPSEQQVLTLAQAGWTRVYPKRVISPAGIGTESLKAIPKKPEGYDENLPLLSTLDAFRLSSYARDPLIGFYYRNVNRDKVIFMQDGVEHELAEGETIAQHRDSRAPDVVEIYVTEARDAS